LLPLLLWLLLLPPLLMWLPLLPFSLLLQLLGLELPLPLPLSLREFERFSSSPDDIDTFIQLESEVWFLGLLLPLPDDLSSSPDVICAFIPVSSLHLHLVPCNLPVNASVHQVEVVSRLSSFVVNLKIL
jgi:hypothetical protein